MSDPIVVPPQMDQLDAQKAKIFDHLIVGIALALVPIAFMVLHFSVQNGWSSISIFQLCTFVFIWLMALRWKLFGYRLRASAISIFLLTAALSEVHRYGIITATLPMLAVIPILGAVVAGIQFGLMALFAIIISTIGIAYLTISNETMPPVLLPGFFFSVEEWGVRIANIAIAAGIGVFVTGSLYRFHQASNQELIGREIQLRKTQSRIAHSAELAGLGYALTDQTSGKVLDCDNSYAEMHGVTVDEFLSLDIDSGIIGKLIHEDDREAAVHIKQRLLKGEALTGEFRHNLPGKQIRYIRKIFTPVNTSGPPDGLFEVVSQDVTETRRLQEQLFQTQKMDAIGKLTGGIAHDFNNLLAVILGNLEILDDEITKPDHKQMIKNGIEASLRGSELTRNMLSFARKAPLEPTVVDLNRLVQNMKSWIGRTIPSTIDVEISLLAGVWSAEVDASSAESGLLNLILNACDAMPEGGKLTIETSNVRIDEDYVELRGEDVEPGRYVLLAVSDTGDGISPENLGKIFEPFFTTKPVGSGSGLGLSMLEGFMKQSNGAVRVYSEQGVGTTFKLYFPAVTSVGKHDEAVTTSIVETTTDVKATILLVEDNSQVLDAMRSTLIKSGYRILEALSGDQALQVFAANPGIDLLLTDIVMPGDLQGTTLAKSLRESRPDLPVVFMSGYASEATVHGNGLRPQDIRLMKPVQRKNLLRAVERALSENNGVS